MKKKLNEEAISNELKTGSSFFKTPTQAVAVSKKKDLQTKHQSAQKTTLSAEELKRTRTKRQPRSNGAKEPRHHDTVVSRYHETDIEPVRKAVKTLGKEAATYRFTVEEKKMLSDIVYTYKTRGIRTSENEITRTAINFIVRDYQINGQHSLLTQVIERLNS